MPKNGGVKSTKIATAAGFKPADFVHLHNHTHYSVLDGLTKIPQLIDRVKTLGMDSVAITDHGTLSGAIEFYKAAKEAEIKPIIGMEAYVAARKHTDKDPQADKQIFHIILIAMNNQGYQNLMRLSTIAHLDGFYYKPRVDRHLLKKYNDGLIVLSGCIGGEVGDALRNNQDDLAEKTAMWYKSVFGDRYYFEVQDHGHQWDEQGNVNDKLIHLAEKLNIELVVTSDAHYAQKSDQEAHEMLLCVQTGAYYSDPNRMSLKDMDLYVEDPKTIAKRWHNNLDALINTKKIAERCNVELELGKILIPSFPVPDGETAKNYLQKMAWRGLAWRYGGIERSSAEKLTAAKAKSKLSPQIVERAEFELNVINKMKFDDYFLIVADFVQWGKNQGIVFGPGRGSAAGSIISYATQITDIDPLSYDLLFERFLNPDRISMPDMDIDIQDNRRDEVIQYVSDKYGHDRVANIVTFGKMAARNAIRDVARVLEVPYADADRLAKLVPPPVQGRHTTLEKHIKQVEDLKREYSENPTSKQVIDLAVQLEGTIRSHGVHAAGVVIAPDDIVKFTPLEMAQKGVVATQYSMWPIEDLGLLKMDFLGLSNLTIIKNALRIVSKVYGEQIDITQIPLDDKKTFQLLSSGNTTGVFQLESSGMKRYLKELKPSKFEDIVAMVALYRPGPMQWIEDFIERKHGRKPIEYIHEAMKPSLENTYGIIVYQEQVMQISKEMCGFSGGQADTLRKGIGKKIPEVLAKLKSDFIEGAIKTVNAERSLMEKFWAQLEDFAAYCFNKSHAACYGLIAYQTAYLKAHYPDAFMAALMTSGHDDTDRLAMMIAECGSMGLSVLRPDVNESFLEFAVVPKANQIRFGLAAIKNVGVGAVEEIIQAREYGGPFIDVEDFIKRVDTRVVNKKTLESLIKSGAFDGLASRTALVFNLDHILSVGAKLNKERETNQVDLFGGGGSAQINRLQLVETPESISDRELLGWERELLGVFLSSHPLEEYKSFLAEQTVPIGDLKLEDDGKQAVIGGMVNGVRVITTKNGSRMAFVAISDLSGEIELIVFPGTYESVQDKLEVDSVIKAKGRLSAKDRNGNSGEELKLLADEIEIVQPETVKNYRLTGTKPPMLKKNRTINNRQSIKSSKAKVQDRRLFIHVRDPDNHEQLLNLKKTLNKYPGATEAILVLGESNKSALRLPFRVDAGGELTTELESLLSKEAVALK